MKKFTKLFSIIVIAVIGFFLFQAQDAPLIYTDDNNPNLDHVPMATRLHYAIHSNNPRDAVILTNSDGYDNFDLGIDLAEVSISNSPMFPTQYSAAWNASGSGLRNRYTLNGMDWAASFPNWGGQTYGDPCVTHDSLGNLYVENMSGAGTITGTKVAKSVNGGATMTIVGANTGNDKNWIAAVQTGGPYSNYIFSVMTNNGPCNVVRSTDQGASFNFVASLTPHGLPGAMVCIGPNGSIQGGSVYVVTNSGSSFASQYAFFRSTDGGNSFPMMSSQFFSGYVGVATGSPLRNSVQNMRTRPYPFITADNSYGSFRGRLYLVYSSNNPAGDGNKPDIFCRYSNDGGATWSSEVTVNDDVASILNHQWHPYAWSDLKTGKLYVQWMDTRNCITSDSSEIYATFSTDGGATFAPNQKISTAKAKIDCISCGGAGVPKYLGDYNGIASNDKVSMLAWTDFRTSQFISMTAYFPDYAMKNSVSSATLLNSNDSVTSFVSIPSVKLYTDKVKFSSSISSPPGTGSITVTFRNRITNAVQDSLTAYPDSIKAVIKTSGSVTTGSYTIRLIASGPNGTPVHFRNVALTVNPIGITPISSNVPDKFYLFQNYPNPFNPTTFIKFDVAKAGLVKMNVYNINGQLVHELVNQNMTAGSYVYDFDASNFASGVYFYKLETGEFTSIRKMVIVK